MALYIPEKVNFDRGFGYKYQYLLATLIIYLIKDYDKYFKDNQLDYEKFSRIISLMNQNNIHVNLKKILEDITSIIDYSKTKYNENILVMMEGHSNYFEDINIFDNTSKSNHIIFLQVKGSDKDNKKENLNKPIKSAVDNFFRNINIDKIENFTFIILTNILHFEKHFFNKSEDDKRSLIGYFIEKSLNENYFGINANDKDKTKNDLINNIVKRIKKKRLFKSNTDLRGFKNIINLHQDLFKILNKIILITENLRLINTLDYRVLIYLLNELLEEKDFLSLLWKLELLSMERTNLTHDDFIKKISSLNFNIKILSDIKFSDVNNKIKYGRIVP